MTRTHFNAEGEVSFKAILFVPNAAERDMFNDYGQKKTDHIKGGLTQGIGGGAHSRFH